jgi:hypothetical protein
VRLLLGELCHALTPVAFVEKGAGMQQPSRAIYIRLCLRTFPTSRLSGNRLA